MYPGASQICDGLNNDCSDPTWPTVPATEHDDDADGIPACNDVCPYDPLDDADGDSICGDIDDCNDVDGDGLGDGILGNAGCIDPTTDSTDSNNFVCADTDSFRRPVRNNCRGASVCQLDPADVTGGIAHRERTVKLQITINIPPGRPVYRADTESIRDGRQSYTGIDFISGTRSHSRIAYLNREPAIRRVWLHAAQHSRIHSPAAPRGLKPEPPPASPCL